MSFPAPTVCPGCDFLYSRCKCSPKPRFSVGDEVGIGDKSCAYYLKLAKVERISEMKTPEGYFIYIVKVDNISFAIVETNLYDRG